MPPLDPNTPYHSHPLPHPSVYRELPDDLVQGRNHIEPWEPVVIVLVILAISFGVTMYLLRLAGIEEGAITKQIESDCGSKVVHGFARLPIEFENRPGS